MDRLRTLIYHRDPSIRMRLLALFKEQSGVDAVIEVSRRDDLQHALTVHRPDLVLLHVPEGEEARLVSEMVKEQRIPLFVFVSTSPEDAVPAFEAGVLDFFLVPVSGDRIRRMLERARSRFRDQRIREYGDRIVRITRDLAGTLKHDPADGGTASSEEERLVFRSGARMVFLRPAEIDWIEAAGVYVRIHAGARTHLVRETLRELEARLEAHRFVRFHRSTIVNLRRIQEIIPHDNGGAVVVLQDGTRLKQSRGYRERVRAILGARFG